MRLQLSASFLSRMLATRALPPASSEYSHAPTVVFLLLYHKLEKPHILGILKADTPGYAWRNQVALPGGHVDETDASPLAAAYRELAEELNIPPSQVTCVGSMGFFQTIQQKEIEVFIGLWDGRMDTVCFDYREISRVLEIPLELLLNTHLEQRFFGRIPSIMELQYPVADTLVWGVTARIFHFFLELLLSSAS